jgi:hypothetical protein
MVGGFPEFREALAWQESRGEYGVVNRFGYLGRYQFGKARLIDLGLMDANGKWIFGLNKNRFLASKALQEATFVAHVARLISIIDRRYPQHFGALIDGVRVTPSGIMAACHLVGLGAVNTMMRKGTRPQDANGTTALRYMCIFEGYDIPRDMPMTIPQEIIDQASIS